MTGRSARAAHLRAGHPAVPVDVDRAVIDLRYRAPDGVPWCRFGLGLACLNDPCLNPNHRTERTCET